MINKIENKNIIEAFIRAKKSFEGKESRTLLISCFDDPELADYGVTYHNINEHAYMTDIDFRNTFFKINDKIYFTPYPYRFHLKISVDKDFETKFYSFSDPDLINEENNLLELVHLMGRNIYVINEFSNVNNLLNKEFKTLKGYIESLQEILNVSIGKNIIEISLEDKDLNEDINENLSLLRDIAKKNDYDETINDKKIDLFKNVTPVELSIKINLDVSQDVKNKIKEDLLNYIKEFTVNLELKNVSDYPFLRETALRLKMEKNTTEKNIFSKKKI